MSEDDEAWFAPKRYGYGAGLPIARQGWALLSGYLILAGLCALLVEWDAVIGGGAAFVIFVPATIALVVISARKTRGGWRWRWGGDE
ncbi:MAG: hypothetical protein WC692_03070 [Erythrobacter sp.]|jgi:hypothetical protein